MGDIIQSLTDQPVKPKGCFGSRHTLTVLGFFGFILLYGMRVNLNLAIVTMVKHKNLTSSTASSLNNSPNDYAHFSTNIENSKNPILISSWSPLSPFGNNSFNTKSKNGTAGFEVKTKRILIPQSRLVFRTIEFESNTSASIPSEHENNDADVDDGTFEWDEKSQGLILGSFYWGALVMKIPGGIIASRIGGRLLIFIAVLGASMMTLVIPVLAAIDWRLLMLARAVQGLFDGCCSPAMHSLLGKWFAPNERSANATVIYAGGQLGTAVTLISILSTQFYYIIKYITKGYLIEAQVLGTWQGIFYILGVLSTVWSVIFLIFTSESPSESKWISKEELIYLQKSINVTISKTGRKVPWREILTSLPVWAIIVANTADAWGFYTLLTTLPTYMKTVLQFDIKSNSWLSALPYLISWGFSVALTQIADYLISSGKVSSLVVRKTCEAIGHLGSAICLTFCAFYAGNTSRSFIVTLLVIGVSINGATYGAYAVNHLDLSPQYAGVLIGLTSTIANISGIVAPSVAGFLLNDNPSLESWSLVFLISSAIYIFDTIFYLLFASTTEQPWSKSSAATSL